MRCWLAKPFARYSPIQLPACPGFKMKKIGLSRLLQTSKTGAMSMRAAGDFARDKQDWGAAETAYRAHVAAVPDDFDIWVQLGHSLKEQKKLSEAEDAYRQAISLRSEDADVHLQLGHLLKRIGRIEEASEAYARSLHLSPSNNAYSELETLKQAGLAVDLDEDFETGRVSSDTVFIEIDDMLGYLEAHKTLSGIQRVQVGVIQHVLANKSDASCLFVLNPLDSKYLWALEPSDLVEMVNYVTSSYVNHDRLKQIVTRARSNATAISPEAGQVYLVLGAFWGYGGVAARYFHLKAAGVTIGVYIYDLIPITHTEYCDEGLPHEFALSLDDGMAIFDFILTISDFTAREVRRYRKRFDLPDMPVQAVPLAHASRIVVPSRNRVWGKQIAHLRDRPFVLMVSTIEARKNHAYLVAAWKHFLDEGLDPPDLVFVGRFGWRVSSLMEMLQTTRYFDNRIHIVHDLSDDDLNTLYSACLFTAFPSFVEGWGLPVGESLAHGKPCVASSTSSIPEVGGDLVDYLDPHNLRDGIEVLRRMIFDEPYRIQRTKQVVTEFQLRSWQDVGRDLLKHVGLLRHTSSRRSGPEISFAQGSVFRPGRLALGQKLPAGYALQPLRLMLTDSWYGIEILGCWLRGTHASLSFRTNLPDATKITAYLQLYGAPWADGSHTITVSLNKPSAQPQRQVGRSDPALARPVSTGHFLLKTSGMVGPDGLVSIAFTVTGEVLPEGGNLNGRRFIVGLAGIGYAEHTNAVARLDLQDELAFH